MKANENIKRLRESRGITKSFVAKKIGMSLQGYRYIEDGSTSLTVERMEAIGTALRVPAAIFLDDKLTDVAIKGAM